jgi:LmbE family N-acetylglucosaminyl deacetylase
MKTLVVAPHPDDEVLGAGGTIHRLASDGHEVTVAIVTRGWAPLYSDEQVAQVRAEAQQANRLLGARLRFMDLPVTRLHALPEHQLNAAFDRLIAEERPEQVLLPFPGDRHEDHRQIFDAGLVAMRPTPDRWSPRRILCYETVSETHWSAAGLEPAFDPQLWIDIADQLDVKLAAMEKYASQIKPFPDARSLRAIRALAEWRGSVVGMAAAETFVLIRECDRTPSSQVTQ